jgi:2-polyprenyl-6-methoxyphenol hydroxylase-like FAD-dependent oxidoreductase
MTGMTTPALAPPAVDVCVHGAGAVGASLALALSRRGLRVTLVSAPAAAAGPDVRAYALNAAAIGLLTELKVWDALPAEARTPVHEMRVAGDQGGALDFTAWQQCVSQLAWIVDAAELERCLNEALRYAPHVERAERPVAAALQAICEGRQSSSREALGVRYERQPYHHSAIAARLTATQPHAGIAWQWFRSPDVLALLPFDRPEAGCSYGLVWSLPEAQAQQWRDAPQAEFEDALQAAIGDAGARIGTLQLASERAVWPLFTAQAEPWCGPGWVLLGDAAHAVHPLAGQGLNLGLGDVVALTRVLTEARRDTPWRSAGDVRLLRRYARERAVPTWAMNGVVDGLWQLFSRPQAPLAELRNRGLSLLNQAGPVKRWLARQAFDA